MTRTLLSLFLLLAGCGADPARDDGPRTLTDLPNLPGGNPVVPGVAMYPFPSDFYLVDDPSTVTGRALEVPAEALPADLVPETFAGMDGFPRAPVMLAWFEQGIDPGSLPDPRDEAASIADDAPTFLVHAASGARVPVLTELDVEAPSASSSALILRAHVALEPDSQYVVIIRDQLRGLDGDALRPSDAFRALRDDIPTDSPEVESQRATYAVVNEVIAAQGLDPDEVVLAWSFHTRSREQVVRPLLSMADQMMAAELPPHVVTSDTHDGDNRLIRGTIAAPDFIGPEGTIVVDDAGYAVQQGTRDVPFLVTIPDTIDETRPVILYGHGFFSHMDEPTWASLQGLIQPHRFTMVSTHFMGFNSDDQFASFATLADLNRTDEITALQMQSESHYVVLSRLVREQLAPTLTADRGEGPFPVMGSDDVVYMGISNGGTQGLTIMSVAPNIDRGVLVVPGGGLIHFLQRASQWNTMGPLLATKFDGALDFQLGCSLMQLHLDPWDSINFVDHLVAPRFEGRPPAPVVIHEAVEDAQVNNMVTHWIARTAGVPVFSPNALEPWGLDTLPLGEHDGPAAMVIYDEGYPPLPTTNTPPVENGAHGSVRELDVYKEHVRAFVEEGRIVYACDGACDPD